VEGAGRRTKRYADLTGYSEVTVVNRRGC
jgi:hypothetical protein